jgi:hypothetical protein
LRCFEHYYGVRVVLRSTRLYWSRKSHRKDSSIEEDYSISTRYSTSRVLEYSTNTADRIGLLYTVYRT